MAEFPRSDVGHVEAFGTKTSDGAIGDRIVRNSCFFNARPAVSRGTALIATGAQLLARMVRHEHNVMSCLQTGLSVSPFLQAAIDGTVGITWRDNDLASLS